MEQTGNMSNVDNIINKIKEDGEAKAKSIIEEAKKVEEKVIDEKRKLANIESIKIAEKAKEESKSLEERIISNYEIQLRNKRLIEKQEYINTVLNKSIEKLRNMDETNFYTFLENKLLSSPIYGDEEIVVNSKYRNIDLTQINKKLESEGKLGKLTISKDEREISGGFIAVRGGIEINCTFDTLVEYLRDDLENLIVRELF